jgi:predicted acylesterase/phospholipase RssA
VERAAKVNSPGSGLRGVGAAVTLAGMPPPRNLFVLGGGGALGAYQVGGLLALAEAGVLPDALFGCSAGALNAAFLASDPSLPRARALASWWSDSASRRVLAPGRWTQARGMVSAVASRADALLDERPLRALVSTHVGAHDVSELAVPLTVTTTCLDCGTAVHADRGHLVDLLVASCSLPGLFPPVRLADGHLHVDGGIICGVPLEAALGAAGPDDVVYVLDCALAPVTGTAGTCAALPHDGPTASCGLGESTAHWTPPVESRRGPLEVVLRSFSVARAVATAWRSSRGSPTRGCASCHTSPTPGRRDCCASCPSARATSGGRRSSSRQVATPPTDGWPRTGCRCRSEVRRRQCSPNDQRPARAGSRAPPPHPGRCSV